MTKNSNQKITEALDARTIDEEKTMIMVTKGNVCKMSPDQTVKIAHSNTGKMIKTSLAWDGH